MISSVRALTIASIIGTVLQLAMVLAGHYNTSFASFFAIGGMGFSLVAGAVYAFNARPTVTTDAIVGGLLAGAICAFIGIFASHLLGDVPASLLLLGTLSSAVTGALGGWIAHLFAR